MLEAIVWFLFLACSQSAIASRAQFTTLPGCGDDPPQATSMINQVADSCMMFLALQLFLTFGRCSSIRQQATSSKQASSIKQHASSIKKLGSKTLARNYEIIAKLFQTINKPLRNLLESESDPQS